MKRNYSLTDSRFQCSLCGQCCHSAHNGEAVVLYEEDICRISAVIGIHEDLFINKFVRLYHYEYRFTDNRESFSRLVLPCEDKCPFLDGTLCKIHDTKPFQCKYMPLIEPIVSDYDQYINFKERCKGLGHGRIVSGNEIMHNLKKQNINEKHWFDEVSNPESKINKWIKQLPISGEFYRDISCNRIEYEKRVSSNCH